MKKLILGLASASILTATVYGQGQIALDNINNTSTSINDTTNGSFFVNGVLASSDFNVAFFAGSTAGNLQLIGNQASPSTSPGAPYLLSNGSATGDNFGPGQFLDPLGNTYPISGTSAGGSAYFQIEAWTGNYTSYAAALAANTIGVYAGISSVFQQTGLGGGNITPSDLTLMPSINMVQVPLTPTPEPSSLALAGLGGFGMLMALRRKKA